MRGLYDISIKFVFVKVSEESKEIWIEEYIDSMINIHKYENLNGT